MALHLEIGNPADPFRVSSVAGGVTSDLDHGLMFSSKYKAAICERHVIAESGGTAYFSRVYPTFPLVIGYRSDGLTPMRETAITTTGHSGWVNTHDWGFWYLVFQDRVTVQTSGGATGPFIFFVIGNIT